MATLFDRLNRAEKPKKPESEPAPLPTWPQLKETTQYGEVQQLRNWLQHWAKPTVRARDIYTYGPASVRKPMKLTRATDILVRQGWLVPLETRQCNSREWKVVGFLTAAQQNSTPPSAS